VALKGGSLDAAAEVVVYLENLQTQHSELLTPNYNNERVTPSFQGILGQQVPSTLKQLVVYQLSSQ